MVFIRKKGKENHLFNPWKNFQKKSLTLVIWYHLRKEFLDKPEEFFKDKMLNIFGKIELCQDKLQILTQSNSQIILQQ